MIYSLSYNAITKVFTEHAYVQYPCVQFKDVDLKYHDFLVKILTSKGVTNMYFNHFVIEMVSENNKKLYVGYHDNFLYIGADVSRLTDSKTIEI